MPPPRDSPDQSPGPDRLDSWKEIAAHLKRDVSTVQRWERKEGLPVHRHRHEKLGSVYAFKSELDAWWHQGRQRIERAESALARESPQAPPAQPTTAFNSTGVRTRSLPSRWKAVLVIALLLLAFVAGVVVGRRSARSAQGDPPVTHTLVTIAPADHLSTIPQDRLPDRRRPSRRAKSGRFEVYVQPYPGPGEKHPFTRMTPIRSHDVAHDGRFLMLQNRTRPVTVATQIHLVLNWDDELRRTFSVN